jgi:NAD(P)-dependent dehydrogenase (short-subunit alcohol dehydrogenase family)
MTLNGKRILILGGTSGIGLAVAEAARSEGSELVVVSSRQSRVDAALKRLGDRTTGFAADLSSEEAVRALSAQIGPIDHLVYTAGDSVWQRPLAETQLEDARRYFDVRFWGVFLTTKHFSKLIRTNGSIVLTSSTVSRRPPVGFAIAASITGAVEAFGTALAIELKPVRVNVVAPGIIRTPIWDRLPEPQREAYFAARGPTFPVGRVGDPADVAEAYLSFMRSGYTTGQTIVVDGGMLLV